MRAIIQAGGKGTRLRNITKDEIPKPMVLINGKPLLQWQIENLKDNGVTEIYLIIGYLGDAIKSYFGTGEQLGVCITYITETEPLGTGGALYYLKNYINSNEQILFIYGDVFFDIDISRMEKFHNENQSGITAFVHPNSHPYDSDILELDENEKIVSILSKKEERNDWYHNVVNAAFYILDSSVIEELAEISKKDFEKDILLKRMSEKNDVYGYHSTEYIKDAGTEERLLSIEKDIDSGYISKKNLKNPQKCIFLDRDGTINEWCGLVDNESKLQLIEGVTEAIHKINCSEYLVVVITNQPVVARGLCDIDDVDRIHKKLETLLGNKGAYLDDIAFCPHHPDKGYPEENPVFKVKCNCRKPQTGLIEKMAELYNISLENSWMIGDTTVDIMTGKNAGMNTILVKTGEKGTDGKYNVTADAEVNNLKEAVSYILN